MAEGAQFVWVPGYWSWDADRNGYIWVSACWRAAPAVSAGKVGSATSASTTVTMDGNYTLVANFAIDQVTL